MDIELNGLDEFLADVRNSPDRLMGELVKKADYHAEVLAGKVRKNTKAGRYAGGRTRQSIQAFVEVDGDTITGGARSDYPNAIFQEFGTGPVAEAAGYPDIDTVGRETQEIRAKKYGGDPEDYSPFTYTEGQPPKAMFHKAMEAYGDKIAEDFGKTVLEVFKE